MPPVDELPWLLPGEPFPPAEDALRDPDGLLALGGDLSPDTLLQAYRGGIFPWFSEDQPILWWSPDPRMVLYPWQFHLSRRLRRTLRNSGYRLAINQDFDTVLGGCAAPRPDQPGTWITASMQRAYRRLHHLGHAHSLEIHDASGLIGGLYGVRIGGIFFGESMFSRRRDASKCALAMLCLLAERFGIRLIDCQMASDHLFRLGAREMPRKAFLEELDRYLDTTVAPLPVAPAAPFADFLHRFTLESNTHDTAPR